MENSPFNFPRSKNDYEIMARIDFDIYFEIELLCDTTREMLARLGEKEANVLCNTYMHQCIFLIDHVLEYIRNQRKTTVHFIKPVDESTTDTCRAVHLQEICLSQSRIKDDFTRFREASSFIFPGGHYPEYLFGLKSKMKFIDIVMSDLFYLEKTKLIPKKVKEIAGNLKFEDLVMN